MRSGIVNGSVNGNANKRVSVSAKSCLWLQRRRMELDDLQDVMDARYHGDTSCYFDFLRSLPPLDASALSRKHHVLPKGEFPEYEKDPSNIIVLRHEDHKKAHYLLALDVPINSFEWAFKQMTGLMPDEVNNIDALIYVQGNGSRSQHVCNIPQVTMADLQPALLADFLVHTRRRSTAEILTPPPTDTGVECYKDTRTICAQVLRDRGVITAAQEESLNAGEGRAFWKRLHRFATRNTGLVYKATYSWSFYDADFGDSDC